MATDNMIGPAVCAPGTTHQAWNLRLNLTQHGETHQVQTQ